MIADFGNPEHNAGAHMRMGVQPQADKIKRHAQQIVDDNQFVAVIRKNRDKQDVADQGEGENIVLHDIVIPLIVREVFRKLVKHLRVWFR
jgi:hypothetical protein